MSETPPGKDLPHVARTVKVVAFTALGLVVWVVAFGLVSALNHRATAQANALYAAKRYAEAEAALDPAIVRDPGNATLRVLRAKARCEAGHFGPAADDAQAAIRSAEWWYGWFGDDVAKPLMRAHLVLAEIRWHEVRGLAPGEPRRRERLAEAHREVAVAARYDASCEHKDLKAELPRE